MRTDAVLPERTLRALWQYYWDRLVRDTPWLDRFRACRLAGPVRQRVREQPSLGGLGGKLGHCLHMVDTLETAWQLGLGLSPRVVEQASGALEDTFDPVASTDFAALIDHWLPLTAALNSLNHSMGQGDAYPFVLAPAAIEKLELVHQITKNPL